MFPIQLGRWECVSNCCSFLNNNTRLSPRPFIGILREEGLLARIHGHLSAVNTHNFEVISLEPHYKDGGVFVKFKYNAEDHKSALSAIENDLRRHIETHGGLPSWLGLARGSVWLVKGNPWREVSCRFLPSDERT